MRRDKRTIPTIAILALLAACGPAAPTQEATDELLYLRTSAGVALVKAGASSPTFESTSAEPAPDWKTVVRSDREDRRTDLTAMDPVTDKTLWTRSLPGTLRVKVVSPGAQYVALSPDTGRYLSQPRHTQLVITGAKDAPTRTIELDGNYEPEAFSTDGKHLFVVQYLPAANPVRYQVRQLNVKRGTVSDVFSVDKELQESMRGTARVQEMSPDGTRLYTLYSVNTPHGQHSFVHVLSLDEGWAHCIDLPGGFAMEGHDKAAIGVTPDGESIYVTDANEGVVAELDAEELTVTRTAPLDVTSAFPGAELTVANDGKSFFVGAGPNLVQVSTDDLRALADWDMPDKIKGIQSGEGGKVYVGTKSAVAVIDTASGEQTQTIEPPGSGSITGLGPVTRGLDPARTKFVCGC